MDFGRFNNLRFDRKMGGYVGMAYVCDNCNSEVIGPDFLINIKKNDNVISVCDECDMKLKSEMKDEENARI